MTGVLAAAEEPARRARRGAVPGRATREAPQPCRAQTIDGGYVRIGSQELALAWTAYSAGSIRALDFRVWLASYEVAHRRLWLKRGQEASWQPKELHALVGGGGGERATRASLGRLSRLGLLTWGEAGPKQASAASELSLDLEDETELMLSLIPKKRRFLPLPRRMLRLLAGGVKRSVMATVLGHSLRCLYKDRETGSWSGAGACSATWVADTFGVGESSVRRARAHLIAELGWLKPLDADQWFMNRHGGRFEVSLGWAPDCSGNRERNSIGNSSERPLTEPGAGHSTPLEQDSEVNTLAVGNSKREELSTLRMRGPKRQNERVLRGPVQNRPSPKGELSKSDPGPERASPRTDSFKEVQGRGGEKTAATPKLQDVKPGDLRSVSSLMELFDQALENPKWKAQGWAPMRDSFMERLNWAAAAHRARVRGGENPAGLFVHLVTKRLWAHVTNEDEDAVRAKLSAWRDGEAEDAYVRPRGFSEHEDEGLVPPGYLACL